VQVFEATTEPGGVADGEAVEARTQLGD